MKMATPTVTIQNFRAGLRPLLFDRAFGSLRFQTAIARPGKAVNSRE
jgi:hypothetical protein